MMTSLILCMLHVFHAIYAGAAEHAVWVQAVKKATPPLIHPHFNEHASIEVHVLINSHIETCMS